MKTFFSLALAVLLFICLSSTAQTPVHTFNTTNVTSGNVHYGSSFDKEGDLVAIGATLEWVAGINSNSVFAYRFDGTDWIESKIVPSDHHKQKFFANGVEIEDGKIYVGARGDTVNGVNSGSIYVFEWDGNTWQESKITPDYPVADQGFSTSFSVRGNKLVATSEKMNELYLFEFANGAWNQTTIAGEAANTFEEFGIGLTQTPNRIVVGVSKQLGSTPTERLIVYERSDTGLVKSEIIPTQITQSVNFGRRIQAFENKIISNAYYINNPGNHLGRVYIYEKTDTNWVETILAADEGLTDIPSFGNAISIAKDRLLIGSANNNLHGEQSGNVYLYSKTTSGWDRIRFSEPTTGFDNRFGWNVKFVEGGYMISSRKGHGQVYLYKDSSITITSNHGLHSQYLNPELTDIDVYPNPVFDDQLTIELTAYPIEQLQLHIYNTIGTCVYIDVINTQKQEISTSDLSSGIYILKLGNSNQFVTKRIHIARD